VAAITLAGRDSIVMQQAPLFLTNSAGVSLRLSVVQCQWSTRSGMAFLVRKRLVWRDALTVTCPACGAKPRERCVSLAGQVRRDPHRERRRIVKAKGVN
jgi:hypothetical protein